jgi:hypothetical protein
MTTKELSINCAAQNSIWIYPRAASQRFTDESDIYDSARSHECPDVFSLPEGAGVTVELYGGTCVLWLEGSRKRVHVRRIDHITFSSEEEARHAFMRLWREVETLESASEVELAAKRWLEASRG